MKRLHFKIKNDLSLLHNELLAEIEELRPVPSKANVWLTVPDNANEKAIQEVVLAHKPS